MPELLYKAKREKDGIKSIEDVPNVMNAVVTRGDKKVYFKEDFPTPEVTNEQGGLIKVEYSAICSTDKEARDGNMQKLMGIDPDGNVFRVLGHEFSGKIVALASEMDQGFLGKDAVVLALYGYCGEC